MRVVEEGGTGGDDQAILDCVEATLECRVCATLTALDTLSRDCDEFDDGASNGSCTLLAHSPSVEGAPLVPAHDPTGCVSMVCGAPTFDTYCCDVEWDSICVDEAESLPVCSCGP